MPFETAMLPHTQQEPRDDSAFLAAVDRIIASIVTRDRPEEVYLVHIDNWFDHKWLRYSGYGAVPFHGGLSIHTAKKEHYQDYLTFPPFTPNRVVAQYLFCRVADCDYEEQAMPYLIHRRERERSSRNLNRRVARFSGSALFVWYSSGSISSRRGSVMVYSAREGDTHAWYACFSDRQGWQLDQVKGTDRNAVASLIDEGSLDAPH
jgi:hypothetical protein